MALQVARSYHVERGEPDQWRVISPAQAPPRADDADAGAHRPAGDAGRSVRTSRPPHPAEHVALRPVRRGRARCARPGDRGGGPRERLPRSSARRSAPPRCPRTRPVRFWEGLAERRERTGFLVVLRRGRDGRSGGPDSGSPVAATACPPDLIATAKGLGAGYAAIGAVLVEGARLQGRSWRTDRGGSRSGTRGTGRRSRVRSASRCSKNCPGQEGPSRAGARARRDAPPELADALADVHDGARGARARLPAQRLVRRSAWTARRSCRRRSASAAGSTRPRSTTA